MKKFSLSVRRRPDPVLNASWFGASLALCTIRLVRCTAAERCGRDIILPLHRSAFAAPMADSYSVPCDCAASGGDNARNSDGQRAKNAFMFLSCWLDHLIGRLVRRTDACLLAR